ncbi:MAG: hypothetical protein NW220_02635 [Leptolyngbyaceae cyanobacterium bins.349]|nr:hypothetical protein [Leptolyngbyaceae cyanobacterium bins.349]
MAGKQGQWRNSMGGMIWSLAGISAGSLLMLLGHSFAIENQWVNQLPIVDHTNLANYVGMDAVLEGQISDRTPARYRLLVAYDQEAWTGRSSSEPSWRTVKSVTPPLWLETRGGTVQIEASETSSDYYFKTADVVYQSNDSDYRYRGFKVQDAIVVVGTVKQVGKQTILDAEFVSSGSRQQFTQDQGIGVKVLYSIGGMFCVAGLGFLVLLAKDLIKHKVRVG